jgi:hypothetical protein
MSYFDARALPNPTNEFVAWIDVMGIQSHMEHSINVTANCVFKLHVAALDAHWSNITLYPVMDGFYATAKSKNEIKIFLRTVFKDISDRFIQDEETQHFRFIIRGAIAYGEIYHGRDVDDSGADRLAENRDYRASIFLGKPVVNAHQMERHAPPFGIAIHESARDNGLDEDEPFLSEWWEWLDVETDKNALFEALMTYYDWCRINRKEYDRGRIIVHEALASKYFS